MMSLSVSRLGGLLNLGNALLHHRQRCFIRGPHSFDDGEKERPTHLELKYPYLEKAKARRSKRNVDLRSTKKYYELHCLITDVDLAYPPGTTDKRLKRSGYIEQKKKGLIPGVNTDHSLKMRPKRRSNVEPDWYHLSLQPNNPYKTASDPVALGDSFEADGDLKGAILAYEAAVEEAPKESQIYSRLGQCYADDDRTSNAGTALKKALLIDPNNQDARLALAISYGDCDLRHSMDHWLVLEDLDRWLSVHMGEPCEVEEEPSGELYIPPDYNTHFVKRLQRALKLEPYNVDLLKAIATFYAFERDYLQAELYLYKAIRHQSQTCTDASDARLRNRLGMVLIRSGRPEEAELVFWEAINRYPNFVAARHNLGMCCMKLGKNREAVDHLLLAIDRQTKEHSREITFKLRAATARLGDGKDSLVLALRCNDIDTYKTLLKRFPN